MLFALAIMGSNLAVQAEFKVIPDTAQYKKSDYLNAIRIERGISLKKAKEIAEADPEIAYFVYLKGGCMVLENDEADIGNDPLGLVTYQFYTFDNGQPGRGLCRVFRYGDALFFTDQSKMWLGSAPELADTYVKIAE